jgi:hypothetical protein
MSAWTCHQSEGKAAQKIVPPRLRTPCWKGPGADSEEKREPASDINTCAVDSLKVLDPERPIREADIGRIYSITSFTRRRNDSGTVKPSALAVVRLITRSNFVGCSTGRSAGLAPRRILSTYSAARRNRSGKFGP